MATISTTLQINDLVSGPMNHMSNAINTTLRSFQALDRGTNINFNAVQSNVTVVNAGLRQMEEQLDRNNKVAGRGNSIFGGLRQKVGGFVKKYASIEGVKMTLGLSDELTRSTARLNMMNDGLQSAGQLQQMVFQSAQNSRSAYFDTAATVSDLGTRAKGAFGSNEEMLAFAEQMNKQFALGGSSAQEQKAGSNQLTQAMAAGSLQGDALQSIMGNAPMLAQAIAAEMGTTQGGLQEMASQGLITADVIKSAMFGAAEETNSQFANMPVTWAQRWTQIQNMGLQAFQPVLKMINDLANSEAFNIFVNGAITGFAILSGVIGEIFNLIGAVGGFIVDNWAVIEPLIWGAVFALVAYNATMGIAWLATLKDAAVKGAHAIASGAQAIAAGVANIAQKGLNASIAACPITWIIIAIVALIAIIIAVVVWICRARGETVSAIAIIAGAFAVLGAFIFNSIVGTINAVMQFLWTCFAEPFLGIIEWILNVANGGFDSFGGAVANMVGQIISWFLSLGKVVTKIIDAIFGTDWTNGLNALQDKVLSWGKNDKAITLDRSAPAIDKRIGYGDAYDAGKNWGGDMGNKLNELKDKFGGKEALDAGNLAGSVPANLAGGIGNIDRNTDTIKNSVQSSSEDLKLIRELAERQAINKFTASEIKMDMSGMTNQISSDRDIDGVVTILTKGLESALITSAEGVHT